MTRKLARLTIDKVRTLRDLLRHLNIKPDAWDALIVSDGSANTWDKALGWASVLIRRDTWERKLFYGGMSHGTNNVAEIWGVLHPLMYLSSQETFWRAAGVQVHIVSDSEYLVKGLKETDPAWAMSLKKNRELWLALHGTRRRGLLITGHHIARDQFDLNRLCDSLAGLLREQMIAMPENSQWKNCNEANPDN